MPPAANSAAVKKKRCSKSPLFSRSHRGSRSTAQATDVTAPAPLEPTGKVVPKAQAVKDFETTRGRTLEWVKTTNDALRDHATGTAPNQMTAYQLVLMLSGHTERHTAQLLEVKASPGYPKQ